ncbi:MAG: Transcriptional regulator, TetR family [Hydrocarboniphaga sp.]|uniref:TetR/AcrR family transcriptional regulator n=1 Tax=Hydrocarboniphaga sp. TaxID=2033016 RepID=UPI00262D2F20|nr:TetR/AcrR family transcriptional regulator [Hydrocarboniphaga sp.]MDB5971486.1 Transcriptional regulator, TetR family [Hydrocarboniphaga sp.]
MNSRSPLMRRPHPPRGRPRDPDKRLAAIAAAKQLFVVDGLRGTSMDAIAKLAGVSKVTLYSYFADKDALFREALSQACQGLAAEDAYVLNGPGTLRARLTQIAEGFFDLITSADAISLYRLMAANPRRHRKLSLLFWEAGPEATMQRFARLLAEATAAGELRLTDPRAAAAQFFFLIKGEQHLKLLIGVVDKLASKERRAHIDRTVTMFLRAYGAAS